MFLKATIEQNPALIESAFSLYSQAKILPDSYILDYDIIIDNASRILAKAKEHNITLYAMTKQIGRNPLIAKKLVEIGYAGIVAVDFKEALLMMENNIKLSHVGHLVQVPSIILKKIITYGVDIITVYSIEKAKEIDYIAKELGIVQSIMLRVFASEKELYSGQQGGIALEDVEAFALQVKKLDNVKLEGITSFPCFLYNNDANAVLATANAVAIIDAKARLENLGFRISQVNMPSATSLANLDRMAELGATHGEPGHALTGTTPYNAKNSGYEKPGMLYVSEVSHNLYGKGYVYGGGYYRRSNMVEALVGFNYKEAKLCPIAGPNMDSIDYYLELANSYPVGATVVANFRAQIFTNRSNVVVLGGLKSGKPVIMGQFDSLGRRLDG